MCSCAAGLCCFSRRSQGLLVTPGMQESMREIIVWHARRCSAALVGKVFEVCADVRTNVMLYVR